MPEQGNGTSLEDDKTLKLTKEKSKNMKGSIPLDEGSGQQDGREQSQNLPNESSCHVDWLKEDKASAVDQSSLFEELFSSQYAFLQNYCMSFHLDVQVADEITSEAFFRLWKHWDERFAYPREVNIAWLCRTVEFILVEYRRDKKNGKVMQRTKGE